MIRLLLETATDVCSVAVARGEEIVAERTAATVHQHASHLTVFIREAMAGAGLRLTELDEIVLSDGPGSYTSLRVGAATAKGLCVALPGLRLRVVPTLLALALAAAGERIVLATINSRRGEVFGQLFDWRTNHKGAGPQVQNNVEKAGEASLWTGPQNIRLTEADCIDKLLVDVNLVGSLLKFGAKSPLSHGEGPEKRTLPPQAIKSRLLVTGPGQCRFAEHFPTGGAIVYGAPQRCSARHLLAPVLSPAPAPPPEKTAPAIPFFSRSADPAVYEPFYLNPPFVTRSKKKPLGR